MPGFPFPLRLAVERGEEIVPQEESKLPREKAVLRQVPHQRRHPGRHKLGVILRCPFLQLLFVDPFRMEVFEKVFVPDVINAV